MSHCIDNTYVYLICFIADTTLISIGFYQMKTDYRNGRVGKIAPTHENTTIYTTLNGLPTEIKDAPNMHVPSFASGLNKFYAFNIDI